MQKVELVSQFTIARDLGLSQAAVSHALKGKRHQCSAETYARVWAHALAIGYRGRGIDLDSASPAAVGQQVGLVYGRDVVQVRTDPAWSAMIWGLEKFLARTGVATLALEAENYPWSATRGARSRFSASKLPLAVVGDLGAASLSRLRATPRRLVTLGIAFPEIAPAAESDDAQAADLLLTALQRAGHRAIGWFGGGLAGKSVAARLQAVTAAATRHALVFEPVEATLFPISSREAGRQAAQRFLGRHARSRPEMPTAIICSDARVARGALDGCALHGIKVPDELSVVALDASAARTEETPTITAAGSDPEAIGMAAGELLLHDPPGATGRARVVRPPARLLAGATLGAVPVARSLHAAWTPRVELPRVSPGDQPAWRSDAA